MAINRSRRRMLGSGDLDLDALEASTTDSPEERVLATDRVARSAEALHGLKPQEVRALWLRALGHSYEEICEITGWSYTKTNRSLAEGRKSFLERYAGIESGRECERLAPLLSAFVDGEADAAQTIELRAHLRQCLGCRAAMRGLHDASQPLTVVLPGVGLMVATGGAEHTGSFFMRVYETVTMNLHERAANSLLRAQAIVDTVTAGKMAAVAASAAAVAGGGFAVEGAMRTGDQRPGAILLRDAQDLAAVPIPRKQRPQPATHARAASKPKARTHAKPRVRARRRASAPPVQQQAPPPTTTTVTTSAPRATVATAGTSAHAASSAASEFGFEGP